MNPFRYLLQKRLKFPVLILLAGLFTLQTTAQPKTEDIEKILNDAVQDIPALNEKVSISVTNVSIQEFLRGVANNSGLNLDVAPDLNYTVINNFSDVKVKDVLLFICRQYNLSLSIMGNIITIYQPDKRVEISDSFVEIDSISGNVTFNYLEQPLSFVVKDLTQNTGSNVIMAPGLASREISGYIQNMPFESALDKLAFSNGLIVSKSDDDYFIIEEVEKKAPVKQGMTEASSRRVSDREGEYKLETSIYSVDSMYIIAENAPISAIINEVSGKAGVSYFTISDIEDVSTLQLMGSSYDEFLTYILNGTDYAYRQIGSIYIIGQKDLIDYKEHRFIKLQNRSTDSLLDIIPEDLQGELTIMEAPELNGLIVSGPSYLIDQFEVLVANIDQVIPVILIEVIILYVNKSATISTGIEAGLADEPVATGGTVMPGVDMTLGAKEINDILNSMSDKGWINIGNVTPNFYLTLQAMETQGILDLTSTPKLSTLNGHEATMSIGNTEYYLEEQISLYGTQNPQQSTSQTYKAVNAELSITIRPMISGDDQITLDIEVHQSDFTERISKTAPPGTVNRDFSSKIRVKNREVIILGGLEEKRKSDTGTGIPLLSKIPVLKWFFSSRKREDSDSKLNVLIRPTIVK